MILSSTLAQFEDETQVSLLSEHPSAHVVWLHGLGASGHDFVDVARSLTLTSPVSFYFPQAPMQPVTLNHGFVMPAWYDIFQITENAKQDDVGIERSANNLDKYIETIVETHPAPVIVGGFSQGGALAIYFSLTRSKAIANFVLSGYLPLAHLVENVKSQRQNLPIFLSHGTYDAVVPIALSQKSYASLDSFKQLEWHEYPMEHQVSDRQVKDLNNWLNRILASHVTL